MRINCPGCETEYDVPEQKLRGRKLKCARCAEQWVPLPLPAPAPPPPEPEPPARPPDPEPYPILPEPVADSADRPPPRPNPAPPRWVAAGWALTFVLCAAGSFAAYHERATIMRTWPPSIRLYQAILPPDRTR